MIKLRSIFNKQTLIGMLWFFCLGVSITLLLIDNSTAQSSPIPNPPLDLVKEQDKLIIHECHKIQNKQLISKYFISDGKVRVFIYAVPCSAA